jgi:hemolysin III
MYFGERLNSITHLIGAVFALIGLGALLTVSIQHGDPWMIAGFSIFGLTLVLLYTMSTLYHSLAVPQLKALFRKLDHVSIYLLIAGTYTPFMSIALHSTAAHALLAVVWPLALAGVVFKIFFVHRFEWLSLSTYLIMGWLALFVILELYHALPRSGFVLLVAGGLCFTLGAVFYAMQSKRFTHAIWHLWVVAGAACHCVAIGAYVIP